MTIRVRNLRTNAVLELEPTHPVLIIGGSQRSPMDLDRETGMLISGPMHAHYSVDGSHEAPADSPASVTAQAWVADFHLCHAFVRTAEVSRHARDAAHGLRTLQEFYKNYVVWVRCSPKLL